MQVGDLIKGIEGSNALGIGLIIERKPPRLKQSTPRIVVKLLTGGAFGPNCTEPVETPASYNIWEVVSHANQ